MRRRFAIGLRMLVLLALVFALGACGSSDQAKVVDQFLKYAAARDAESAYALFSSLAKAEVPAEAFAESLQGDFGDYVQGYQDLSVSSLNITSNADGTYAEMNGTVNYADGSTRAFDARLDKENDIWLVTSLNIE
jgi:hypothetical protein